VGSRKKQRLFLLFHNQLGAMTIEKKNLEKKGSKR
jgi:hypothetical protein